MSLRQFKPPPETFGFVVLKLLCTLVVLCVVLGFYAFFMLWFVIAAHPPEWTLYLLLVPWLAMSAITYTGIKSSTKFGRYLCDWPRYY